MKCDELKRHRPDIMVLSEGKALAVMVDDPMGVWCHIQDVHDILDEKNKEIAELKKKLMSCLNGDCILTCEVVEKYGKENAELNAKVKLCSDFELAARKDIEEMRGQHQMLKQFGHYKLSPVPGEMINHEVRQYVSYNVVCMIINHLESENAELKQKLENVQASMYCDVVDANMENRRLRRALWIARALRARDIQRWWIAAACAPITERACSVWNNVERKCRAKAEEYK